MPLSDIVSCPIEKLEEVITHEEPYGLGTWFFAKRVGMIELCKLGEILGVGSYDELTSEFNLVGEPLDDGPWPQTIPVGLISRLKIITDDEINAVVSSWAQIEEFKRFDGPGVHSLSEYLKGLRAFLTTNAGPFFLVNAL